MRAWARSVMAGVLGAAAAVAAVTPAEAAAIYPCSYPYVCLYNSNSSTWAERYQVVTSGFQSFNRRDIIAVRNTRHDDVAFIRYTNGRVWCVVAGEGDDFVFAANAG